MCLCTKSLQSCLTLGDSMNCDSPGKNTGVGCNFFLQGIFPHPRIEPMSFTPPTLAGGFFFFFIFKTSATWEALVGWITVPKDIPSYPQILSICLSFCIAEGTLQMWSSQTCWVEEMMLDYLGGAGTLTWGRQGDQGQGGPQTKKVEVRVRLGQDGGCEPAMPGPWELETLRKWSLQMQSCWYLDFSW